MEAVITVFIIAAALIFAFGRMSGRRVDALPEADRPKRQSRRERKLEAFRAANPDPELPTMFDLMMEEARESGVNDIPGGDDIEVPVKLKVWRRDTSVRESCDGDVRFEVQPGIKAKVATEQDVRLVCAGSGDAAMDPSGEAAPDPASVEASHEPPPDGEAATS